ncbi:hypothetical protein D9M69_558990 [compost metagenome]
MLFVGSHFTKGLFIAIGLKHRIITEADIATRRPDQHAFHFTAIILCFTIRPCKANHRNKARLALIRGGRSFGLQKIFDLLHRHVEITRAVFGFSPVSSVNTRIAIKRVNHHAGIVRQRRQTSRFRRSERLDISILLESRAGFFRLRQAESGNRTDLKAKRGDKPIEFAQFACIVRCDDQFAFFKRSHCSIQLLKRMILSEIGFPLFGIMLNSKV